MMALIEEGIAKDFEVHRLHEAGDPQALLRKIGPNVRAICTGSHTGVKTDEAMMALWPGPQESSATSASAMTPSMCRRRPSAVLVVITNTPDVLTEEVADTRWGCCCRPCASSTRPKNGCATAAGRRRATTASRQRPCATARSAFAGFGRIGKAIARRIEAFGLVVSYYGRNPQPGRRQPLLRRPRRHGARRRHACCRHPRRSPATANLIDARVLDALGRAAFSSMSRAAAWWTKPR